MRRGIIRSERFQNVIHSLVPNVNQHVRVGEALHRPGLLSLVGSNQTVVHVTTIVVLGDLLVGDRDDPIVIVLEPPSVLLGLDQGEVMASVQIPRMHEHTVQLVDLVLFAFIGFGIQELGEVDLKRELVAVVDLSK
jgi:hypothetical protein